MAVTEDNQEFIPLSTKSSLYFENEEYGRMYLFIQRERPFNNFREYRWQESYLAELFAECFGDKLKYCPEAKEWFFYNGTRWVKDTGAINANSNLKIFAELMSLYADNVDTEDASLLKKYQKFIAQMGSRNVRDRILKDARDETAIPIETFDSDPYLINCQNGTYDLKRNEFREHRAEDYLTMMTNCTYPTEKTVKFDRWDNFISEITKGSKGIASYLQRALGYSLCGVAKEECMFIAYGKTTRNGKGTLFNTIHNILGDYAKAVSVDFICVSKNGRNSYSSANPMLADFKGARFITLSESQDMARLDEAAIKNFTGNDLITTRQLYGKPFSYIPQFKMWLSCNTLPRVRDKSLFSSDRIKVVEFNKHFSAEERDPDLKRKFLTEDAKSYIFKWLIDGYSKYSAIGLSEPKKVKEATEQYEKDNDFIQLFIDERCVIDNKSRIGRGDLYTAYKAWCRCAGLNPMSSPRFKKAMEAHAKPIAYKGSQCWKGIALSTSGEVLLK